MTIEHNDFQQGFFFQWWAVTKPQYHGSGLIDARFVEDDDDDEFLLDKALARDGLYRGMFDSSVILSLTILSMRLIWTRQIQESFFSPYTQSYRWLRCRFPSSLALVPTQLVVFTTQTPSTRIFPYPGYPPCLPFPILEALSATAVIGSPGSRDRWDEIR